MNSDLKLILVVLTNHDSIARIAINIPDGMNDPFWSENYEYFNETEVFNKYKKLMPQHCKTFIKKVLEINECFEIIN